MTVMATGMNAKSGVEGWPATAGAKWDAQVADIAVPHDIPSQPAGEVQFWQWVATVPVEAKHACTGNTHAITNAKSTLAAISFRCLCWMAFMGSRSEPA